MSAVFGSTLGVTMEFEDAWVSGLRFGRAKRWISLAERFSSDGATQPAERVSQTLDTLTPSFESALVEQMIAHQVVAGGSRVITIRNVLDTDNFSASPSARRGIAAEIQFVLDRPNPVVWTMRLGEPASSMGAGTPELRLSLGKATTIKVSVSAGAIQLAEATLEQPHPAWSFDLPSGQTTVTLLVHVRSWANVSDTVVICRPAQMREAAIALAAVPDRRFVPLMVLEPPPMSLADLCKIFRAFHSEVEESRGHFGAFGIAEFERSSEEDKLALLRGWMGRRTQQEQMQPYRSWAKRNKMLRKALLDFGLKRAICLFEPTPADLVLTGIEYAVLDMPLDAIDISTFEGLLDGLDRIVLQSCGNRGPAGGEATGLDGVYEECRRVAGGPSSTDPVEVVDDGPAAVILGLYEARRAGRPLRISTRAVVTTTGPVTRIAGAASGEHVVAVEVHDQAQSLIAPLFAADLGTTLITTQVPDLGGARRIVRELQAAVVEHAQRSSTGQPGEPAPESDPVRAPAEAGPQTAADPNRFLPGAGRVKEAFRKYVFGDRRPELIGQLEREVSRQVSPTFVEAVGTSALTVFGSGLPYSFVKSSAIDWSTKHIGHVIADADLIVISELHNAGAIDPIVSFNLIVDPGFFSHSETDAVAEALKARPAQSLILRKDSQIGRLFPSLASAAPLDFIFFNTHGNDDSILLGDYPLRNYQITQWFEFDQRPLIFNNSCMSWTGVGKDFVRVGARGYVGTLWSVGAEAAADLARRSMARMIDGGEPICGAIRQAGIDPFTSRAYIFVGTAKASFPMDKEEKLVDDPVRLVAVLQHYVRLLSAGRNFVSGDRTDAFTTQLYAEFKVLRAALIAQDEAHLLPLIADAMLAELEIIENKGDAFNTGFQYRLALADRCREVLADAPLDELGRDRRMAQVLFYRADIHRLMGDMIKADADAKASIVLAERIGRQGNNARQVRIQVAIDENRLDDALALAEGLLRTVEEEGDKNFEMATLGRLCQILKRTPARTTDGLKLAQRGIDLALSQKNLGEESTFALDLAQIHLVNGNARSALPSAQRALATSRRASSAIGELSAYGTIGQCYRNLKDAENARIHARLGLARAKSLDEPRRVATFLADLALAEELDGNGRAALDHWIEAVEAGAPLPKLDIWQGSIRMGLRASLQGRDVNGCARLVANAILTLQSVKADRLDEAGGFLFSLLPDLLMTWPPDEREGLCRRMMQRSEATIGALGGAEGPSAYGRILFATCMVFGQIEAGLGEMATRQAKLIDDAIGAQGSFINFVAQAIQKKH